MIVFPFSVQLMSSNTVETANLLVFGYTRSIQEILRNSNLHIPIDVLNLCVTYYFHHGIYLFILTGNKNNDVECNSIQFINIKDSQFTHLNIYGCCPLTNETKNTFHSQSMPIVTDNVKWDKSGCSMDYASNIKLPDHISSKYKNEIQHLFPKKGINTNFDAVFQCGGRCIYNQTHTNECFMMLFDANQLSSITYGESNVNALSITLPPLPSSARVCSAFSGKYGLFCMPNENNKFDISRLCLTDNPSAIEWKPLDIKNKKPVLRSFTEIYEMIAIENGRKLFIIGNKQDTSGESIILDLESMQASTISKSKFKKSHCGMCFDKENKFVFCVSQRTAEYFVIDENKWISLPHLVYDRTHYPCLWIDNQMLFVAGFGISQFTDKMEFLDLRDKLEWEIVDSTTKKFQMKNRNMQIERIFSSQNL